MMINKYINDRLQGIQQQLIGAFNANKLMTAPGKGHEREILVNEFLSKILPVPFRFGTGEITDSKENNSKQVDIVIEYPIGPSFPIIGVNSSKIFLAETVSAVIEVKSDIEKQCDEVIKKAKDVFIIKRDGLYVFFASTEISEHIPFYSVAYTGWKSKDKLSDYVKSNKEINGVLIIEHQLYCSKKESASGPDAMLCFICDLCEDANAITGGIIDYSKYR